MGKFFVGNPYHDDMCGEDGQLKLQYRYMPKEELERISQSMYDAERDSTKYYEHATKKIVNGIEFPPFVKVLLYEYEHLKRRSKRLEILERAFLECQKSEFEEFNELPNCSFVSDKKQKDVEDI